MTSFNTVSYWKNRNLNFYDAERDSAYKQGVWATCPLLAINSNPSLACVIFEDFANYSDAIATTSLPGYTVTQATAGSATLTDGNNGILELDSASSTVTQGVQVQKVGECFLPAANKDIWYETRLKVVDTFDDCEFFAGLSDTDTTIIATSANSSDHHIGWQCVTDDGVLLFTSENSGTGNTTTSNTLAEDTFVKLGFHVSGLDTIDFYVNDVKNATQHETANIPITELTPSFVCQSGGTADPILHVDYYMCVQLR